MFLRWKIFVKTFPTILHAHGEVVKWKSLSHVWLFVTPWTIYSLWNSPRRGDQSQWRHLYCRSFHTVHGHLLICLHLLLGWACHDGKDYIFAFFFFFFFTAKTWTIWGHCEISADVPHEIMTWQLLTGWGICRRIVNPTSYGDGKEAWYLAHCWQLHKQTKLNGTKVYQVNNWTRDYRKDRKERTNMTY